MKLTVVELFAGVGGFRVGLNHIKGIDKNGRAIEKGEWEFVWANQYEPSTKQQHAYECYTYRFGVENHSNVDINKVDKSSIPFHSLLVGGFPCQDYSVARSISNEKGIEGKKGVLFWDIKDIIETKNPYFVLLENVDRLLKSPSSQRGRDFAIMLKTFDELGYNIEWRIINAGDYSMPQKRRRIFIFAYKQNTKYNNQFKDINNTIFNLEFKIKDIETVKEININNYKDVVDISNNYKDGKFYESGIMKNGIVTMANIEPILEDKYTLGKIISSTKENKKDYVILEEKLDKWKYLKGGKKIERTSSNGHKYVYSEGSMAFPDKLDEPARTMLTSEGTLNRSSHIIYDENMGTYRILLPEEAEKIQMFPEGWTDCMPIRKRYFMMGNALVTGIISRLEPRLKKIIENE
ncbi:MAG: DNA (cytosine-5-)-methyltransferase [Streptobacillus sp.]